ncbi:MAG: hypothetical protein E7265_04475 [Lachnospiraceae bacterium]|nr:hypothetical protein [Lachnospiraceae bacterium]
MELLKKAFKYGKWIVSIVAAIFAVMEFLEYFGVFSFSGFGIKGIISLFVISIIGIICKIIYEKSQTPNDAQNRINEINEKITDRIGVLKSSEKPDKDLMDSQHSIALFERMDILDYSTNDYMSYRIINGKNDSKSNSPFLKYKESTDSKTSAKELIIKAYDLKTGKELKVEFEEKEQKVYVHKFKIMFTTPLKPQQEFSIIYFIKIPNELSQLSDNEEMMSVSLNRFEKKIEKLRFGVYLDFIPVQIETFLRNQNSEAEIIDSIPELDETGEVAIDERFKIFMDNISIKSKIQLDVEKPKKETYVIYYRK